MDQTHLTALGLRRVAPDATQHQTAGTQTGRTSLQALDGLRGMAYHGTFTFLQKAGYTPSSAYPGFRVPGIGPFGTAHRKHAEGHFPSPAAGRQPCAIGDAIASVGKRVVSSDAHRGSLSGCSRFEGDRTKTIVMKLAIVGKGGVGKTTLAAALARRLAALGRSVVAVDADPDGNLPSALGVPEQTVPQPIAHMRDLILERTDAKDEGAGLMFKLNPQVDDLPERFSVDAGGVRLLVLGTVESGGKGCMCPEGAVLKALLQHLLLRVADDVILDMEAGLEHMGRASASGVDAMIAVVEPGMRSVQTAARIQKLAHDIGIKRTFVVANKVRKEREIELIRGALSGQTIIGMLPYSEALARADLEGRPVDVEDRAFIEAAGRIGEALESRLGNRQTAE